MSNIVEQTFVNNVIENIGDAIEDVGGDVSQACCACEYPKIIRDQLTVKKEDVKLNPGDGIEIIRGENSYTISSNSDALLVDDLNFNDIVVKKGETIQNALNTIINNIVSSGASTTSPLSPPFPIDKDIPAGTPFQVVFEKLFDEILPVMSSILDMRIIKSSNKGEDDCTHPKYPTEDVGSKQLIPDMLYIRVVLSSQKLPIYISCEPIMVKYKGSDNKNINVEVDNTTNTISASINEISAEQIPQETINIMVDNNKLEEVDAESIFKEIFK